MDKTILKYFGGKSKSKHYIIPHIPKTKFFRSVFLGAGGVEFSLNPIGTSEVWNDVDKSLMNFYTVLQIPELFKELIQLCELTPYSEDEFYKAKDYLDIPIDRFGPSVIEAKAFFLRNRMSRGGDRISFQTPTKRLRRDINENVSAYLSAIDGLVDFHNRIKYVEIRSMHFRDFIPKYDHKDAFLYCDPSYLLETRVAGKYRYEMSKEEHIELLYLLSNISGKFLVHGYFSDLYNDYAKAHGWNIKSFNVSKSSSGSLIKPIAQELMYTNY